MKYFLIVYVIALCNWYFHQRLILHVEELDYFVSILFCTFFALGFYQLKRDVFDKKMVPRADAFIFSIPAAQISGYYIGEWYKGNVADLTTILLYAIPIAILLIIYWISLGWHGLYASSFVR
ncbi:MAG: hypothetical protein ACRC9Q_01445 [Bacteroidales bacterium]